MKRSGILHPALCQLLASMGHTDYLTITDRSFPVPPGPQRIDLALVNDLPTVLDVLRAIITEFESDRVVITTEMTETSPQRVDAIKALIGNVPLEEMEHAEFLQVCSSAQATIRTGDTTPYGSIMIVSGKENTEHRAESRE